MTLLGLAAIGLFVFLMMIHARAKRALDEVEELKSVNTRAWEMLRGQIRALEAELGRLKAGAPGIAAPEAEPSPAAPRSAPAAARTQPLPVQPPPAPAPPPPVPMAVPVDFAPPSPRPLPESVPQASPRVPVSSPATPRPMAPPPAPAGPSLAEKLSTFNWEELLGTQVFLRLGVAVVVLGVVLFLGLVFTQMGAFGKVAMGVGAALAMILGGLYGESKEAWRTFGRVILAGGWGVLYFTAFAMRFVAASQVIQSTPAAVALLMAVAAGAVLFSLRYKQEWTTAFAFLLIYLSLGMAAVELQAPFTLPAALVASAALGYLAWHMGWARLLGLGALASWACLGLGAANHAPGGLPLPLNWLCLLGVWAAFVWPVLAWRDDSEEPWLGMTLVASGIALMGLGLQEGFATAPTRAWMLPLAYGLLGLPAALLLRSQSRRGLFKVQTLLGLLALGLVGPLRVGFRNGWLPVLRMVGIEALFAAGIFMRERFFRVVALAAFALTFMEIFFLRLGIFGGGAPEQARLAMLVVVVSLSLLNAYLLRGPWAESIDGEEAAFAPPFFNIGGATFLACLIWMHAPHGAVALLLLASALLFQEAALATGHRELPWLAQGLAGLSLIGLFAVSLPSLAGDGRLRVLTWAFLSLGFYLSHGRAALSAGKLTDPFRKGTRWLHLMAGLALALGLVLQEAPSAWIAPLMALLALLHLGVGLRASRVEWTATSGGAWLAALLAVGGSSWSLGGDFHGVSRRLLSVGAFLALGYTGRLLVRRARVEGTLETSVGWALGCILPLVLAALIWVEAPALWAAPLLALALLIHAWAAVKRTGLESLIQVAELFAASLLALVLLSWPVESAAFFSPRLGTIALAILGWYLAHLLFLREEGRGNTLTAHAFGSALVDALPMLGALGVALAVKGEALAHDKNLLVSLAWGLLGLLHLEGARALARRAWFWISALALAAGAVHLLLVNVPQPGELFGLSLRTLTVLPFLPLLVYAHVTVEAAGEELDVARAAARWKALGIFAGAILGASYLLYELHRAAVIVAWSALALGHGGAWIRWRTPQLRLSALGLLAAVLIRTVGVNLALRDEFRGLRLNLFAVPAACLLLLLGFVLLNRDEQGSKGEARFGVAGSRFWLLGLLAMVTAYFWVEASGKELTIWWSLEGLAAVALGFMVSERWARLAGLSLLSFCILKLFVYDLRGLEGMARILSFIVLGLVLVGVSWVYTRFKERLL
ncbi:MAG: DUF2339 domain-containing protein [Acidobacteria bacterium]|nr:DUF2339 domain-containing protein [Acidobacteriota bacterium]